MDVGVLGPLEVWDGARLVILRGGRERTVLTLLAVRLERAVSEDELVDILWGDKSPGDPRGALHTYVSRLRQGLVSPSAPGLVIESAPAGYRLRAANHRFDWVQAERLGSSAAEASHAGDWEIAKARLDEALALWRGEPLGDLHDHPAMRGDVVRFQELREHLLEERMEVELALGGHQSAIARLVAMVDAQPLRERRWGQLMLALYRSGRQAEALRAYQQLRHRLAEDLGVDPSPDLVALDDAIIHQTADLAWSGARRAPDAHLTPPVLGASSATVVERRRSVVEKPAFAPLPIRLSTMVGRAKETSTLARLIGEFRLVSLTGSGGCGKTRLALAAAARVAETLPISVCFVSLELTEAPEGVAAAVAEALRLANPQGMTADDVVNAIGREFPETAILLVLDNCEDLCEASADLVMCLLTHCPHLRILVTTREVLGVPSEVVWSVAPLPVPPAAGQLADANATMAVDSVRLFVERARTAWPELEFDSAEIDVVARICREVDGIPLAIELAAGLLGTIPLPEVARCLSANCNLPPPDNRQLPPRHRSLDAAMDWSFAKLSEAERSVLISLTPFAGGFTLEAAKAVASTDDSAIARLVRKSLLTPEGGPRGIERYRMLMTVRVHAERVAGTEALDDARRRHATYFQMQAEDADKEVHGPHAARRLQALHAELQNFRTALRYSISKGDLTTGARLAGSLRWFFGRLSMPQEARHWLAQVVERRFELPPDVCLEILTAATACAVTLGEFHGVRALGDEAISLARALGSEPELATALTVQGGAATYSGELDYAMACFDEAETLWRRLGDRFGLGWLLGQRGVVLRRQGHLSEAASQLREATSLFEAIGNRRDNVVPTLNLGLIAQQAGKLDEATAWCQTAVDLAVEFGDRMYKQLATCSLGRVVLEQGNLERARQLLSSALVGYANAEHGLAMAIAIEGMAIIAGERGRAAEAVVLWGYSKSLRERLLLPMTGDRVRQRDTHLEALRRVLGEEDFGHALERGQNMTDNDAVALAVRATDVAGPPSVADGTLAALAGPLP